MKQAKMAITAPKKMFVFAGEKSGDMHGSHLIANLRTTHPSLHIEGIAGPLMRACGVTGPFKMEHFEVMGLTDVLLALPRLCKQFYGIRNYILKTTPEITVLIDSPSFNLRLAQALRRKGYQGKIIQYVSPSVWAWGQHRIQTMANSLDLLMTIYPFETTCFQDSSLKVSFVGNPLQEYIAAYPYNENWKEKIHVPSESPLIALFPGSRHGEIMRNLPLMLDTAMDIHLQQPETAFGISCGHPKTAELVADLLNKYPSTLKTNIFLVPKEFSYELMRDSRCAIAKSGTVTLELALHQCPTIVLYTLTKLNRLYAKYILKLKLPHYCIVNILADAAVFPEFIETAPSKEILVKALNELYTEGPTRANIIQKCICIGNSLGNADASQKAANTIRKFFLC